MLLPFLSANFYEKMSWLWTHFLSKIVRKIPLHLLIGHTLSCGQLCFLRDFLLIKSNVLMWMQLITVKDEKQIVMWTRLLHCSWLAIPVEDLYALEEIAFTFRDLDERVVWIIEVDAESTWICWSTQNRSLSGNEDHYDTVKSLRPITIRVANFCNRCQFARRQNMIIY